MEEKSAEKEARKGEGLKLGTNDSHAALSWSPNLIPDISNHDSLWVRGTRAPRRESREESEKHCANDKYAKCGPGWPCAATFRVHRNSADVEASLREFPPRKSAWREREKGRLNEKASNNAPIAFPLISHSDKSIVCIE